MYYTMLQSPTGLYTEYTVLICCRCDEPNMLRLYPWVHQFCNLRSTSDQTRAVSFPDVNPADISTILRDDDSFPQFSMAAGDFLEVYNIPGNKQHSIFYSFIQHALIFNF